MELPTELRWDILEQIDLKDLIRVRKALPEDQDLIEKVFRNMFRTHEMSITYTTQVEGVIRIYYGYSRMASIKVKSRNDNIDEVLEFLECFGHCIDELDIEYHSNHYRDYLEPLQQQISKYVAKSVNKIRFRTGDQSLERSLTGLIAPFTNCEIVIIHSGEIDAETLHYMFPAVRRLCINWNAMNESLKHFPHLERLEIENGPRSNLPLFEKMLELNPQIRHLSLSTAVHLNVLKVVNKFLPAIESLDMENCEFDGPGKETEPLRFTTLKVLKSRLRGVTRENIVQVPLEFGNLEEIEFASKEYINDWIDIVVQNKKLRIVTANRELQRDHLQRIADALPNLEDFSMEYYDNDDRRSVEDIVHFIQSANQLKIITLFRLGTDGCEEAIQQLSNEWENTSNDSYRCFFVRKGIFKRQFV